MSSAVTNKVAVSDTFPNLDALPISRGERHDEIQRLVGQWQETSALLERRDAIVGVSIHRATLSPDSSHTDHVTSDQDLFKLVTSQATKSAIAESQQENVSQECANLRDKLDEMERRQQAIRNVFVSCGQLCDSRSDADKILPDRRPIRCSAYVLTLSR